MKNILESLSNHFLFLFEEKGFVIRDSKFISKEAATIILTCDYFFIRIYQERSHTFMDIGCLDNFDVYSDSYWVRKIMGIDIQSEENHLPKIHADFLKTHFDQLKVMFNTENATDTIKKAKELYHQRWSNIK
ncbi:MAG: hypothetical protein JST86_11315 [Bacteroidetes bacterium]|nr:hypothetical protein [Bacteroidota bacterium]